MKKITFISILIFNIFSLTGFSQIIKGKSFTLSGDHTGYNRTFIACDYIKLIPDFKYTAQESNKFIGKIDPSLIYNTNYTSSQTPHSTDLPVGSLPGSVNVSSTGAATYQIPIALPPGTAGMMPNLSIVYNSQSGDGMLGRGWTIGGFSAITRIPATLYHDDMVDGVDFDANDRFALDGQRLIAVSGTYGASGTVYHTEIESFSEVISYGTSGNGPLTFKVKTKSGTTLEYAYTENSRIQAPGRNDVMYWLLNKVTDALGNYYTITYKEKNGEFYPLQIDYTGHNSDLTPYNKVKFFYTRKTDQNIAYVEGSAFKSTVLLSDIRVYNNDKQIRKYSFKYNYNSFSRLSEIKLYENASATLNTTKIEWGEETPMFQKQLTNHQFGFAYLEPNVYTGDYDGDGQTDIIEAIEKRDGSGNVVFDNFGIVREKYVLYTVNDDGKTFTQRFSHNLNKYTTYIPGDFNGDGNTDLLQLSGVNGKYYIDIILGQEVWMQNIDLNNTTFSFTYRPKIQVADFNGDGKSDWMIGIQTTFPDINYSMKIYSYAGNNNATEIESLLLDNTYVTKIETGDFNGNGKSDIYLKNLAIDCIYELDDSGNLTNRFTGIIISTSYPAIFPGDYNGDGKTDMLIWESIDAGWKMKISKGNFSFINVPAPGLENTDPNQNLDDNNIYIGDYNGDGKTDILEGLKNGTDSKIKVYYSQEFVNNEISFLVNTYNDDNMYLFHKWATFAAQDFNGDGKQDFLLMEAFKNNSIMSFHPHEQKQLVKSVTNGYNNKTEFEFKPITDASVYRKSLSGADFPLFHFQGPLYVVKNLTVPNGTGGTTTQNYFYKGARVHRQGKGFIGFTYLKNTNMTTHICNSTNFTYTNRYFYTYPVLSRTFYYIPGNLSILLSTDTVSTVIQNLGNKRIFTFIDSTKITDFLTNTTIISCFDYDNDGNLTRSSIDYDGEGTTETIIEDYSYTDLVDWCKSKPGKVTVKKQQGTKPIYTRTSEFEYYGNGLLKKSIADPYDANNKITTEYWYNSFGNAEQTKVSAPAEDDKNSYFTYDSKYRFVTSQIDPLGFTSEKTYNVETGNILTQTDINSHVTKFEYDAFGSLIETELPDGTKAYQTTEWYSGDITNAKTYVVTSADGEAPVTTYYDKLGRKIRTETSGFNNEIIISEIQYNSKGQVYKMYEPHFTSDAGNYTRFYYDDYGRQTSINAPIGTTSYLYEGKTTTVTMPDGQQTSKTVNSLGQVTDAKDNGGIINYKYNSAGLPDTITAPGGAEVTIIYDNFGNKTSLTDPDAGTITYTYDVFSNIETQTDANGNMHEMEYDIAGRITEKSGPEGVTNYVYDVAGNGLGMLASESGINGNTKTYTYDNLSRLSSVTETFEGENYTYSYIYDEYGRINQMTYPSGFSYTNNYKLNGYLKEIRYNNDTKLIWKPEYMNALGQITQLQKGNGLTTYKTYDNYHRPETVVTGAIQDITYDFEKETGNLLSRRDNIHSNTENFDYDDLNRLTEINTNGTIRTVNYNNTGNITDKTDAGTYIYDKKKIHAVTKVNGDTYLPSFDQNIRYTAFNKVANINEGNYELNLIYGLNNQRKKTILYENKLRIKTKYFFGSYEKTINHASGEETEYNYLPGGAIFKITGTTPKSPKGDLSSCDQKSPLGDLGVMLYTYTDHLGSITHITNTAGNLLAEQSFDAWGRIRNPETWELLNSPFSKGVGGIINDRGYTGHEMLPQFAIINMNGRLYDPILGRMLSPDNYIQMPDFTQNFNRYSYVLNNPLKYVDPDGEIIWFAPIIIGAMVGAFYGGIKADKNDVNFLAGMGKGALVGAVGGAFSHVGGGSLLVNMAWGAVEGGAVGGLDAALWGQDVGRGIVVGAAYGTAFGAFTSGIEAYGNYNAGYGFKTNESVLKGIYKEANLQCLDDGTWGGDLEKAQDFLDFLALRYGEPSAYYKLNTDGIPSFTDIKTGEINIDINDFVYGGFNDVKISFAHETGHYIYDIYWKNGEVGGKILQDGTVARFSDYMKDGISGYHHQIQNAGKFHINYRSIAHNKYGYFDALAWSEYSTRYPFYSIWDKIRYNKWISLTPKRF